LAAFSPGTLIAAIDREARAVAAIAGGDGGVQRASTATTALSQHCPCGERVPKRLGDRVHACPRCDLRGDRDDVSAILASFVVLAEHGVPASARVDYPAAQDALGEIRRALRSTYLGWQDTPSESTGLSARDGSFVAWSTPTPDAVVVARRNVGMAACSTLHETGSRRTTAERARWRTNMSPYDPRSHLRDNS
ncbi:MAG: transposase, partial [Deltaproteobacteria bacterium]|nr:transposase [Deltaproteobacteria bacterium]